jgi:hypothetical protein
VIDDSLIAPIWLNTKDDERISVKANILRSISVVLSEECSPSVSKSKVIESSSPYSITG